MMTNIEQRLYRLEQEVTHDGQLLAQILARLAALEQQQYAAGGFGAGGGSGGGDLWCQLSGSLGPATGTWPSITATTATADVYTGSGASISKVQTGATIYNRRNVTWSAGKTSYLVPSGSGYAIIDQDC